MQDQTLLVSGIRWCSRDAVVVQSRCSRDAVETQLFCNCVMQFGCRRDAVVTQLCDAVVMPGQTSGQLCVDHRALQVKVSRSMAHSCLASGNAHFVTAYMHD